MGHFTDLTGQKKNALTVIGLGEKDTRFNRLMWNCLCECGNQTTVCTGDWNAGRAKSCGCYKTRSGADSPNFKHGLTRTADYQYRTKLKARYGIDGDEYDRMMNEQNGLCAICGSDQKKNRGHTLAVDHCHHSGIVRGLLCHTCNRAIGMLGDNTLLLAKALKYLSKHEVKNVSTQ